MEEKIKQGHIHADAMRQYAKDAQKTRNPWELWEFVDANGTWARLKDHPFWHETVRYRRIDPYRELKEAQAAGKKIQCLSYDGRWLESSYWNFNEPPEHYRIKPEPTTNKVKLLGWLDHNGELRFVQYPPGRDDWVRIQSEDKEIEIEVME